MTTSEGPFLAIISGRLAGLTPSIRLTRQNISYKRDEAATAVAEMSTGSSLGPNSITALKLIDLAIKEVLKEKYNLQGGNWR
tara:strand:- start:1247 stop:1492 length:246 start_codon:yes stop_codon:yes gene_type:complete